MWQNSSELLNYVLRRTQVAIGDGEKEIQIVLKEHCKKDVNEIREVDTKLDNHTLTEILR
ncbi:MAG: hypothetical protein IKV94_01345 [Clostridia bacterium]|nr:hypothetical protein [Clostridia bacterium]